MVYPERWVDDTIAQIVHGPESEENDGQGNQEPGFTNTDEHGKNE